MPTTAPMTHAEGGFRRDINGLRAYAVISVLLYHAGVSGFGGGFAGVDVFFVISGFLMTSIILRSAEAGRFTLSGFYLARVRRIFPALLVVCVAVLAFGWFWLAPYLYENVGRSAGSSLMFTSNFTYDRAGGYFAAPAHDNWLLHTWSVSVEWQFYLLYPLFLLLVLRLFGSARQALRNALWLVLAASFAFSIYLTASKPSTAFFMLSTRAWELLAGGLVFLHAARSLSAGTARLLELAGLALVAASVFLIDSTTPWPGYAAAWPVIGTCLILLAARHDSLWTGNVIAQALGRWSYSIYLWHWPLVVGMGYFAVRDDWRWVVAIIAASIVLGAFSYSLIEQTSARWMRTAGSRRSWQAAGAGFVFAFSLAAVAYFDEGVARTLRLPPDVLVAAQARDDGGQLTKCNTAERRCVLGDGATRAFVWGDSHAIAAVTGAAEAAQQSGGSVLFYGQQSCPVTFDARSSNPARQDDCRHFNDMVLKKLEQEARSTPVIVISRYHAYMDPGERLMYFDGRIPEDTRERHTLFREHMVSSLYRIAERNPVYVLLPIPEMPYDVTAVVTRTLIITGKPPQPEPAMSSTEYDRANAFIIAGLREAASRCGIGLLDPVPYFCADGTCPGYVAGEPLYSDDNHLSRFGAGKLAPLFATVW
jgi:peptidoglycan/LPS O-acetylase OafA/YrhL